MDNMNYFEPGSELQEQVKESFKIMVSDELYCTWADSFEVEQISEKSVLITYYGFRDFKEFKNDCKEVLQICVQSAAGSGTKIKLTQKEEQKARKKKTKEDRIVFEPAPVISPKISKNIKAAKFFVIGMIFVCVAAAVIVVMCNYISNRSFRETFYNASSIKVDSNIRVIQISDLHNTSYGKNNQKLVERINDLEPDIIICTGDIVNSAKEDVDYAVALGKELANIAPSYYVYGNNEAESIYDFSLNEQELDKKFGFDKNNRDETALLKIKDVFEEKLESAGINVLKNEKDTIKVKTIDVDVYGVLTSNPSAFWSYSEKAFGEYISENTDNLKITAVHEPFIFEEFQPEFWGDLMVCGHTHGGVIRVPVLGPLYTHEGGLFPERSGGFVYGRYDTAGRPLIVSSGLENKNVLRMNNQPELVVIDINKF